MTCFSDSSDTNSELIFHFFSSKKLKGKLNDSDWIIRLDLTHAVDPTMKRITRNLHLSLNFILFRVLLEYRTRILERSKLENFETSFNAFTVINREFLLRKSNMINKFNFFIILD